MIRAAGKYRPLTSDFRAHKPILSLVPPVFKDMPTVPQSPSDVPNTSSNTSSYTDAAESTEIWESIPRTIYPIPIPAIGDLTTKGYGTPDVWRS